MDDEVLRGYYSIFFFVCCVSVYWNDNNNELVYPKCDIFDIVGMENGNVGTRQGKSKEKI